MYCTNFHLRVTLRVCIIRRAMYMPRVHISYVYISICMLFCVYAPRIVMSRVFALCIVPSVYEFWMYVSPLWTLRGCSACVSLHVWYVAPWLCRVCMSLRCSPLNVCLMCVLFVHVHTLALSVRRSVCMYVWQSLRYATNVIPYFILKACRFWF